jgi:nitric oxide reductase NorE protein
MFIVGDLIMFSLFFGTFVFYRSQNVELYAEAQNLLNQTYGLLNTLLMLTSSWFVALAVKEVRARQYELGARRFLAACLCGIGFVMVKYFEYSEKFTAGITLETNEYFMYYYLFTGIHLLHVIIGLGVLVFCLKTTQKITFSGSDLTHLESGASFWHLVDMLWIVLFALLYLMR